MILDMGNANQASDKDHACIKLYMQCNVQLDATRRGPGYMCHFYNI